MPVAPPRELKIGAIIDETLGVLECCALPASIFVVVLTVLNGGVGYFGLNYTSIGQELAKGVFAFTVGVAGAFFLLEAMLAMTGFRSREADDAFLPYVGLSILSTLGVVLGLIVFIIPGLFLIARWSVAQPLLIVRGNGVVQAMQDSWERTKGSEFSILLAVIILYGLPTGASILAGFMFEPEDPVGIGLSQFASVVASVLGLAMAVALYGLLVAGRSATKAAAGEARLDA